MKKILITVVCIVAVIGIALSYFVSSEKIADSMERKDFILISEDSSKLVKGKFFDNETVEFKFDGLSVQEYYSICSDTENYIWVAALQNEKSILTKVIDNKATEIIQLDFVPLKISYYNGGIVASEINGNIYFIDVLTGETTLLNRLSYNLENASYCAGGFATDGTHLCWVDNETITIMSASETKTFDIEYGILFVFGGFYDNQFFFYHQSDFDYDYYLYSINMETGEMLKMLADDRDITDESFVVNGKQIATYYDPESWTEKIYVRDLETFKEKLAFVPDGLCGTMPQFSPGRVVVF